VILVYTNLRDFQEKVYYWVFFCISFIIHFDQSKTILFPNLEYDLSAIDQNNFEERALSIFRFQAQHNPTYKNYLQIIGVDPLRINSLLKIPFLPIEFFKTHKVVTTDFIPEMTFESSGTTMKNTSRHYVRKASLYKDSLEKGFRLFYGEPRTWCIIGLLPSYLERQNSSLVFMVNELMAIASHKQSGFYLKDFEKLASELSVLERNKQKTLLIGVTYALLDFAEQYPMRLEHTRIMETGGMKGRRQEITREAVHEFLKNCFRVPGIDSEYGMSEILSQAYAVNDGIFRCPPWMKVFLRDEDDPLSTSIGNTGFINIIDLANFYSCSFIATDDLGKQVQGGFQVLGRSDLSDMRGCNLLVV